MNREDIKNEDGRGSVLKLDMGRNLIIISWSNDGPDWRIPCWEERETDNIFFIRRTRGLFVKYEGGHFFITFDIEPLTSSHDVYYPILSQNVKNQDDVGYIRKEVTI